MRPFISRSLALCAVLCLGGCATTSQTAPAPAPEAPPPQAGQAQAPAPPEAPGSVPAAPLKRPEPLRL
ncbi:MAG TPA: insulinase family protein, partial [Archangium sp.]|nr:insulinase family protein [Archangium sp.]